MRVFHEINSWYWQVETAQSVCALGNEDNLFEINQDSGNITMQRPAEVVETITLTALVKIKH